MPGQPVIVWRRGYPAQPLQLDAAGQLSVLATESFGASALTGPGRPAVFGARLQLPGVSPLFYWSDVARPGPRGLTRCIMIPALRQLHAVGGGLRRRRLHAPPNQARRAEAVAPVGGKVLRWSGTATLQRAANTADGRRQYALALVLQQQGEIVLGGR